MAGMVAWPFAEKSQFLVAGRVVETADGEGMSISNRLCGTTLSFSSATLEFLERSEADMARGVIAMAKMERIW